MYGSGVTVYPVIGLAVSELGAVHVTSAAPFSATAVTLVGAPGGPIGVTGADTADSGPAPAEFDA